MSVWFGWRPSDDLTGHGTRLGTSFPPNSYKELRATFSASLPMSASSTQPTLPESGKPLDVGTWITQVVTTASGSEAIEIADAIAQNGFRTPTEVAGLLCDESLYKEIVEITRTQLNLRHRSILSSLAKACKEVEA